jgi:hypothetical protein
MSNEVDDQEVEAFFMGVQEPERPATAAPEDDVFGDLYGTSVDGDLKSAAGKADRGVIKIGKRRFAVGLYWSSVPDGVKPEVEAVKVAAEDASTFKFFCVRNSATPQFGLAHSSVEGYQSGDAALAAMLAANQPGGDWVGAFSLDGGYYLCAIRNGQVLPGVERFYKSSDAAQVALERLLDFGNWSLIVAPSTWGVPGAEFQPIEALLSKKATSVLKPVSSRDQVTKLVMIASIIGVGAAAVYFAPAANLIDTFNPEAIRTEMDEALEKVQVTIQPVINVNLSDIVKNDEIETPPTPPWVGRKNGVGMLISCQSDIFSSFSGIPGWRLTALNCGEQSVSISFQQTTGTVPEAEAWVKKYFRPDIDLSEDLFGTNINLTFPASYVTPYTAAIEADDIRSVEKYLNYWFISLGESAMLTQSDDVTSLEGRYYEQGNVVFNTSSPPVSYAPIFSRLPGFIVNSVSYRPSEIANGRTVMQAEGEEGGDGSDGTDGEWMIDGTYYKKRPSPIPAPVQE